MWREDGPKRRRKRKMKRFTGLLLAILLPSATRAKHVI